MGRKSRKKNYDEAKKRVPERKKAYVPFTPSSDPNDLMDITNPLSPFSPFNPW